MNLQPLSTLLIIALSLALNLHALAGDSFWGDEILTATFAGDSPANVIRWTATDIHPPLYYLIAGAFTRFTVWLGVVMYPTHTSDWLWRFPSAVAGVLAVAVTYGLAHRLSRLAHYNTPPVRRLTANSAALLLCLAPIAIKYGQEARMHGLFMLLAALSTWLFFRAMSRPEVWCRWLLFALATTVSIYTMYFGFLILAVQGGFLLFSSTRDQFQKNVLHFPSFKAQVFGFSGAVILAFLLYIPWWPVLLKILGKRAAVGAIEGGVGSPLGFMLGVVNALGPTPAPAAWGGVLLFIVGLSFLIRHYWPLAVFGGLWLALPTLLPIILGDPRALQFRYAFVLPVYLTIVAYGVVNSGIQILKLSPVKSRDKLDPHDAARYTPQYLSIYLIWVLATLSFIATLGIYNQTKPNWRDAAAFLNEHIAPADIILIGPLWDEGRFIDYYYRGQAQLLTPAAMVTNIEHRVDGLRAGGGQMWAVNRFAPAESQYATNIVFSGVVISEPQLTVYEPAALTTAAMDLAAQAVDAAYPWAAEADSQGVLDPDPRTARAAALRAWGDTLVAAGRPAEAIAAYQTAVDIFPGWVNGFIALAEAHEITGNVPNAVEAYQQAVNFNLQWQGPQADEAYALVEAGRWEDALERYRQIIGD